MREWKYRFVPKPESIESDYLVRKNNPIRALKLTKDDKETLDDMALIMSETSISPQV